MYHVHGPSYYRLTLKVNFDMIVFIVITSHWSKYALPWFIIWLRRSRAAAADLSTCCLQGVVPELV